MKRDVPTLVDRLGNAAIRTVLAAALRLPYRWRVPAMGWVAARIAAPLAGWHNRIRANLAQVCPDLSEAEIRRLQRRVPDNFGRALIETYSGAEFLSRMRDLPLTGDAGAIAALEAARDTKRPVIFITGHFGNYEVPRGRMIAHGYPVGAIYNAMSNPLFNAHYVRAMSGIGTPLFERSRRGVAEMVKFLRGGGMVAMVVDHYMRQGTPLDFLGQPARTALSAAEMALKYDALVIPIYGRRRPDGLTFDILVEAPIPHGTATEMTQAMNDSLARLVRETPEQWFWIHRRWKNATDAPSDR